VFDSLFLHEVTIFCAFFSQSQNLSIKDQNLHMRIYITFKDRFFLIIKLSISPTATEKEIKTI
jgi:hypothetical protein